LKRKIDFFKILTKTQKINKKRFNVFNKVKKNRQPLKKNRFRIDLQTPLKKTVNSCKNTFKITLQSGEIQALIELHLPRATTQKTPKSSKNEIGK